MGSRGPAPKRSDQRRRSNTPAAGEPTKAPGASKVPVPRGDSKWHPVARRWYASLAKSGQSAFYEPSDWATAYLVAESMSRELSPQGLVYQGKVVGYHTMTVKAGALSAWLQAMTVLMVTEGDRRRAALELQRPKPSGGEEGNADVSWIDDARQRLRSSG
jgi:hypothetical protein